MSSTAPRPPSFWRSGEGLPLRATRRFCEPLRAVPPPGNRPFPSGHCGFDAHIERALPVYRHKRDLMLATMAETFPDTVRYTTPDGGLFVGLTFPEELDATAFMAEKLLPEAKVAFVPGAAFFPVEQAPNTARMSFSGVPDDRLVHGVTGLGRLLHRAL